MRRRKKNLLFQSKKANAFMDLMMVILVLMGMAIFGFVGYKIFGDLNSDLQSDPDLSPEGKAISGDLFSKFPSVMDGAFVFAAILLWVFVLVSSVMVDSHPMFFIISLVLLLFAFGVIIILGNSFEELVNDDEFVHIIPKFPMSYFIMTNLLTFSLIIGSSMLIVLYGKNKFIGV